MGRARRREAEDMQLNLMNLPTMPAMGGSSASVENYEPEAEGDSKQQGLLGGGGVGVAGGEGGGVLLNKRKKKQSSKTTMLQVAVPILLLPAILLASMLPFILPTLKMATILSLFMNNGAFLAAMLYAYAATSGSSAANQPQHISYGYADGFH
ncbi:CG15888 [Drosophila busckii]|uniref:CG15888 n=2 Tax=Drosophila busckii TaxID=30019 RepID=A0A0M4ENG9_DROBS|nr:CG15888 [Drosophila busckii]